MVRISLTPIIDVVFILLIFFMLATNFQSFNKTDIKLSNESASISQSDKQIYLVEFNKKGEYKLNKKNLSLVDIKNKIVEGIKENEDEYMVVIKGSKDTDVQDVLNVIAKFKMNQINIFCPTIGVGGVEKNLYIISNYLVKKNIKINVITCDFHKKKHFNKKITKDWEYQSELDIKPIDHFTNSIKDLLKNNYKVILIYPIPSPDFHVIKRLMQEIPKTTFNASKYLSENPVTYDLNNYYEENINIINSFDKLHHKNLIKIIPEKIFCDPGKNLCFTHSDKDIYFSDQRHLAEVGAGMLVDEVEKGIEKFIEY